MKNNKIRFSSLPTGATFAFFPHHPESKFSGLYRKVSPRRFTDGQSVFPCAASATVAPVSPAMLSVQELINAEFTARGSRQISWAVEIHEYKGAPVHRFILSERLSPESEILVEMIEADNARAMYSITRSLTRYHARRVAPRF